jgi:class 3 adenylate cyclase
MFCDLVGSTVLSKKLDPEELRSLLNAYRTLCGDVIARYDGFVARYVGDGILTYFGWPTAHEEDAERAVRAALEIVHTVKRASSTEALSVRIGIATGPVMGVIAAVAQFERDLLIERTWPSRRAPGPRESALAASLCWMASDGRRRCRG